jgi:hypothetical protein
MLGLLAGFGYALLDPAMLTLFVTECFRPPSAHRALALCLTASLLAPPLNSRWRISGRWPG